MPSFDIVNKINLEAFKNAVDGVNREIENRYDFKGSVSKIIVDNDNYFILAESDMKINQLKELLSKNLVRKDVNVKSISFDDAEKASGGNIRIPLILNQGINKENAQKIKYLKDLKIKIQNLFKESTKGCGEKKMISRYYSAFKVIRNFNTFKFYKF